MPENPFFVGGPVPPDRFVGRTAESNEAYDQIANQSHLALWGSPGMGKSSLLRYLAECPEAWQKRRLDPTKAIIVSLHCTALHPFTPPKFWRGVLSLLREECAAEPALQSAIEEVLQGESVGRDDLRRVLRKIGQRDKFLLLLLDDYDAALRPSEAYTEADMWTFLMEFRHLADQSNAAPYLSTVVTTFRRLSDLGPAVTPSGSPWYNHYLFRQLKPFTRRQASVLFGKMPTEWDLTALERTGIWEVAYGHPALLQNACYLLYAARREGETLDAEAFAKEFVSRTEQYFRDAWAFSTEAEQMLMMLIALSRLEGRLGRKRRYNLSDVDSIFSQMGRELYDLEEQGVIKSATRQGRKTYSFSSSLMEWWVIKEIENSGDESELDQRLQVFHNLSRKQLAQIRNVMLRVWEYKDAMVSIVGWVGKLVGAFTKGVAGAGS